MKRAAIGLALALATLPARAEQRWYIAHLGSEACVPLDGIGPNLERLHYGAGTMRTPADYARLMSRAGQVTISESQPGMVVLTFTRPGGEPMLLPVFQSEPMCTAIMEQIPR